MTALMPQIDLTWINDESKLYLLEVMLRDGKSVDQIATVLKVQSTAVSHVIQTNDKIRRAHIESLDFVRATKTRSVADKAGDILDRLYEFAVGTGDDDKDAQVSTKESIAASNLYLQAAGLIGSKAVESEKRMAGVVQEKSAQDEVAQMIIKTLVDRALQQ